MDVLFDRRVNFIDEVEEIIQERGGQTRDQIITSVYNYKALPACTTSVMEAAIARHEAEVEAPAPAILRERKKASSRTTTTTTTTTTTGAWRKEPVTFAGADAVYCRNLLDGVDPVLPEQLAAAPAVNSLTLRVSWPPRQFAATGYIESSHENLLVLRLGADCYRDDYYDRRRQLSGCYLVLNTRAKSVAVVPPLPFGWVRGVNDYSHGCIGGNVAVLRTDAHDDGGGGYLLAELFRHTDRVSVTSNKGTLFIWRSPSSGSGSGGGPRAADQWIWKEVELPLPDPDEDGCCFNFNAETVFAVSSTSLCWVDLWAGFLVCNNISSTSTDDDGGDGDGELVFTFIPLPEECAPRYSGSTDKRAVCCVDSETIKLLCMDDDGVEVTVAVTTWTLKFPLTDSWRWEKDEDASCSSLCVADLLDDAIPVDGGGKRRLLRRLVRWPVIGRAQPGVAHVCVDDIEFNRKRKEWEPTGLHEVSLDVPRRSVASVFTFPAGSYSRGDMLMAL